MRKPSQSPMLGIRDAESLFRSKPIVEIREIEATTRKEIESKQQELRNLVGNRYRDLIDSADSIIAMKSSSLSISSNISSVDAAIRSLSLSETPNLKIDAVRARIYAVATRVKYLVDTPENIWGCLDESMLLEAAGRYLRAKVVHGLLNSGSIAGDRSGDLARFPLLGHQWQIVESFRAQISQRSRERLADRGLGAGAYADALAAVTIVDELSPVQVLALFLDSRRAWISQAIGMPSGSVSSVFCDVVKIIQLSLGQVGELFLQVLNDMPLFYKIVLGSPPGTQLFGGITNLDEEVRIWKVHREGLESVMVMLEPDLVARACLDWLKDCSEEVVGKINGRYLIDAVGNGEELASTEKLIRAVLDGREALGGSLEWLRSVFGSEIESPWNRLRELVLKEDRDLWDEIFEGAFVKRMKDIVDVGFKDLSKEINVKDAVNAIVADPGVCYDFEMYLMKPSTGGGVWFLEPSGGKKMGPGLSVRGATGENDFSSCLNAYFGPEVSRIRDVVDSRCESILNDLLHFLESPSSVSRLKELAPYLQDKCYTSISIILKELEDELGHLSTVLGNNKARKDSFPPAIIVERSLFIGRLLFALRNHSSHIPLILGSPRLWSATEMRTSMFGKATGTSRHSKVAFDTLMPDSPKRQTVHSLRRQSSSATAALFGVDDSANPKLDELNKTLRDLCIKAHNLWITWVSNELSVVLFKGLEKDDALSATTTLRGWEEMVIKQEQSSDGPLEMKIALPSIPSLYVTSFLFQACQEIHKVGGHVLDKSILRNFAWSLLEKVLFIYGNFISTLESRQVSEKGVLQILLDIRFTVNILSGAKDLSLIGTDSNLKEDPAKNVLSKPSYRRKPAHTQTNPASEERFMSLVHALSMRLDPIDWATYEPYLWENEKQSYQRHAVVFGFLVQLNRIYTDTVQKVPSNADANILRCSTVPRFKYLPISAPALARGTTPLGLSTADDISSRSSWKAFSNGELSPKLDFEDSSSFGVATPLLKSFMTQVGSKFGESTMKLGSTFGDILPVQAAGLLSSFTAGATRSDS